MGIAVSISEAAERLGVTLPRLQRALKRPEFAAHVRIGERPTRTGTRTVTLVSVSVLGDLSRWLGEQKHKQKRPESLPSEAGAQGGQLTPAEATARGFYERLDAQRREQIAELKAALEHERQTTRALADALAREQALRALPPPQAEPEAVGSPETDTPTAKGSESEASGPEKGVQRRPWWERLWGRGGG